MTHAEFEHLQTRRINTEARIKKLKVYPMRPSTEATLRNQEMNLTAINKLLGR